ncbi:hypothetical protein EAI_13223 [Harpegnathos saltator]|uniref:Uncharacterized protein n=1 Tax=Harpegnathos saltator TaxID=610380 RepID=E2BTQ1_HARSA|nr:hypothetical protein EAI_13223 [Harpegnathos saltator]
MGRDLPAGAISLPPGERERMDLGGLASEGPPTEDSPSPGGAPPRVYPVYDDRLPQETPSPTGRPEPERARRELDAILAAMAHASGGGGPSDSSEASPRLRMGWEPGCKEGGEPCTGPD